MTYGPRRLVFDAIVQVSKLVRPARFDSEAELKNDLSLLARAYGVEEITPETLNDPHANKTGYFETVEDYYTGTEAQFSGVHSPDGAVHFGLDWDGQFRHDGFLEQARIVEELIRRTGARSVLELGSGKGINSIHLARRNPAVSFMGVDLTPLHVRIASERGKDIANLRFARCDFHALACCSEASFDVVFDVEAGCYSDTPEKLEKFFAELRRVLRPGGHFVQFGYFRSEGFAELESAAILAARLVERAWVIEQFHSESAWKHTAERFGLVARERSDLRAASMPSVQRLYQQAKMFYKVMASSAKPLVAPLVRPSTHNSVSAMMLPYAYGLESLEYPMNVLALRQTPVA